MKNRVKCFFLESTNIVNSYLRRYYSSSDKSNKCPHKHGYHDAKVFIGKIEGNPINGDCHDHNDSRWPKKCDGCEYIFTKDDYWQLFTRHLFINQETGEEMTIMDSPAGAMWYADWLYRKGPDGRSLMCKLPDGHNWNIDGRASNCNAKDDNVHRCWNRSGTPPMITVVKDQTVCKCGGGSIASDNWHGFLRNGYLEEC